MYHLSTKVIKRSEGRSAVGASAYRSASKMVDDRSGKSFNYSKKHGVLETGCFMMNSDRTLTSIDRETLWNVAEKTERRKDSRTAREIIVNLPHELTHQERKKIVERFSSVLMHRYGVAVDWAMHAPDKQGDQRNYHAHIMLTTREISLENGQIKLGKRTDLEQANKDLKKQNKDSTQDQIKTLRRDFADITNAILSENNIDARIDHRSFKDRGLYVLPTQKLGWQATEAERSGIKTHKGDINRAIQAYNDAITEYYAPLVVNDIEIYNLSDLYRAGVIIDEFQPPAPTPKPKPAPKSASAPVVHHAPPPAQPAPAITTQFLDDFAQAFADELSNEPVSFATNKIEPAPTPAPTPPAPKPAEPPPPPKPVVISLPLTASYIPGGYNRPLFQQPTVKIGHYKGYKEFESGNVRMGQVDIDLSTMQIINETITKHYPAEYHDDFSRLIKNNAYAFLGRDDKGNERMGFDKYNEHIKQYHRTSFQCDSSFHADINKAFEYLQQTAPQVQQQARQERENSYDFSR